MNTLSVPSVPEQGQFVSIRNRFFIVLDIISEKHEKTNEVTHKVSLECIDDDRLAEKLDLIWELEVNKQIYDSIEFPKPDRWDTLSLFESFICGLLWSCSSLVDLDYLKGPFMGAIEPEDYQFLPVERAISMPRVNLLIADDVGLGKTIEAGLVVQELLARQRIRRIMIVCPASLMIQWKDEMLDKFNLRFRIIDRDAIADLQKEYGIRVNPWHSHPMIITSMDFIKRDQNLKQFRSSIVNTGDSKTGLKDWDLLIVDEAHNIAPSGKGNYIKDSDRTNMMKQIVDHFENRLFLTATPHNGYTYSFTALLEMLDPLRFSRGPTINEKQRDIVMIRRMKEDIINAGGVRSFAKRNVMKIEVDLPLDINNDERQLFTYLDLYCESRLKRTTDKKRFVPVRFALTLLKKRLLSSPLAFYNSLNVHLANIHSADRDIHFDEALFNSLHRKYLEDWNNDYEKSVYEEQTLQEGSKFFEELTPDESHYINILLEIISKIKDKPDSKAKELLAWIRQHLLQGNNWQHERLIIFTEYKDTMEYIEKVLMKIYSSKSDSERIVKLYGGMTSDERESIKTTFQTPPAESPVRILLATDAASEGLNLQNYCRYLIHYEIPWNPNKMEQRNGRIDRHGQRAPEVKCCHFVYTNHEDSKYLQIIIDKMQTQRADIGSIGDLIEKEVEKKMIREQATDISYYDKRCDAIRAEAKAEVNFTNKLQEISRKLSNARKRLNYFPDMVKQVVEEAVSFLVNHPFSMQEIKISKDITGYLINNMEDVFRAWPDVKDSLKPKKDKLKPIIFDSEILKSQDIQDKKSISLIHLNHPLLLRSIGLFKRNMWLTQSDNSPKAINRVSYKVLPESVLNTFAIIGIGRIVFVNHSGQKLHEGLIKVGGYFTDGNLSVLDSAMLDNLYDTKGTNPDISKALADMLRGLFPHHRKTLESLLEKHGKEESRKIESLLKKQAKDESEQVRKLIKERIEEIQKRIDEASKEKVQLSLAFDEEELFDEDMKWLERRKSVLEDDLKERPIQVEKQYEVKLPNKVYPVGLLYLIPDSKVK